MQRDRLKFVLGSLTLLVLLALSLAETFLTTYTLRPVVADALLYITLALILGGKALDDTNRGSNNE
jgi:hypothetical protein